MTQPKKMQIFLLKKALRTILNNAPKAFNIDPDAIMDSLDFDEVDSQNNYWENLDIMMEEVNKLLPCGFIDIKNRKITDIDFNLIDKEIQQQEDERKEQESYNTPTVKNPLKPTQRLLKSKQECDIPDIIHPEIVEISSITDKVKEFIHDKILITYDPRDKISKKDLYDLYVQYCASHSIMGTGIKSFGNVLIKTTGTTSGWIQVSYTKEAGQIKAKAWCGLKLKDYIEGSISPVSL
jgi:hypothetical protein